MIESFQLDGGNGRVVYNGTEPRFWGVVFYFTIAVLVVAGVVTLIVFLRRRAIREEMCIRDRIRFCMRTPPAC